MRVIGLPADHFVDHGSVADLRRMLRLDAAGITEQVREALATLGLTASVGASPAGAREARTA